MKEIHGRVGHTLLARLLFRKVRRARAGTRPQRAIKIRENIAVKWLQIKAENLNVLDLPPSLHSTPSLTTSDRRGMHLQEAHHKVMSQGVQTVSQAHSAPEGNERSKVWFYLGR